jgi:hypothetical protein
MEFKMKATEFAYWLQGYFDHSGVNSVWTETQAKEVFKKAESVRAGDISEDKAEAFVGHVKCILNVAEMGLPPSKHPRYLRHSTDTLREALNNLFNPPAIPEEQKVVRRASRSSGLGWPG